MEWVIRSSEIHSTFSNLGFLHTDGYHINENCNAALHSILENISAEDKYLRTFRRSISFGQNIKRDLIPLLIHTKEDTTIELLIKVLVDLTIPVECLLSVDVISKNDYGRHTIFEINNLLKTTKTAFMDHRATKVVIDFLKKNVDFEQKAKMSPVQCKNICNSLLLLRNILHIPEETNRQNPGSLGSTHPIQNQILWNMFSQSIDKLLIKLMIIPDANNWAVTMVQLIALLYKDQHVVTLHKLLNLWLEASLSESSEDNESNTSPPARDSEDSSPMLTSDPTSDSSDTGASGKSNDKPNSNNKGWDTSPEITSVGENTSQPFQTTSEKGSDTEDKNTHGDNTNESTMKSENENGTSYSSGINSEISSVQTLPSINKIKKKKNSTNSDCGYSTQIENQESISTSSNEDEFPTKKPVHQKPHNPKQRINNKAWSGASMQERKRKKIVRRGKCNILNVQGLSHKTPTDDDIANILKEFTVDFLLKGYNSLVYTLHNQILTNIKLEIDTSHFFWLVSYFLKFATQIALDVEHVCSVLTYDILSYLTAEGVNLCEQFELSMKLDGNDLKPSIRRLHLVVTALREFIQATEVYRKFSHVCNEDQQALIKLQIQICDAEELRSLLVLLLRHYNSKLHTKQYLQDLVVTNHILLMFLDSVMKLPQYNGKTNLVDHIKQFATVEIMNNYGLLLEDYSANGEFVNDCVFTMMHHVAGELDSLIALYQPRILKTFTSISKAEFEICDDWSDLVEYVMNTFIKKPHSLQISTVWNMDMELLHDKMASLPDDAKLETQEENDDNEPSLAIFSETWTEDELSSLTWSYMQCSNLPDMVGQIMRLLKEDDIIKSRESVIGGLFRQNLITEEEYEKFVKGENDTIQINEEIRDEEIKKLCDELIQAEKLELLTWVQKVLLDICFVKICLNKISRETDSDKIFEHEIKWMNFGQSRDNSMLSPVSYHCLVANQSVPLVPWNCKQASICKNLKFLKLLHKLGFHMPVDTGKVFIRIPYFWTADHLYEVASKILPIDISNLKFSINDISASSVTDSRCKDSAILSSEHTKNAAMPEMFYQIHKQKHSTMMNYTPMPGSIFKLDNVDIDKNNWLKFVQKSQEYKITLKIDNKATNMGEVKLTEIATRESKEKLSTSPVMFADFAPQPSTLTAKPKAMLPCSSFRMPNVMGINQVNFEKTDSIMDKAYMSPVEFADFTPQLSTSTVKPKPEFPSSSFIIPKIMGIYPESFAMKASPMNTASMAPMTFVHFAPQPSTSTSEPKTVFPSSSFIMPNIMDIKQESFTMEDSTIDKTTIPPMMIADFTPRPGTSKSHPRTEFATSSFIMPIMGMKQKTSPADAQSEVRDNRSCENAPVTSRKINTYLLKDEKRKVRARPITDENSTSDEDFTKARSEKRPRVQFFNPF